MNLFEKFCCSFRLSSSVWRFTFLIAILGFSFNPASATGHFKASAKTELPGQVAQKVAAKTVNYFSGSSIQQVRSTDIPFSIEHLRIFGTSVDHQLNTNSSSFTSARAKIGFHPRTHS